MIFRFCPGRVLDEFLCQRKFCSCLSSVAAIYQRSIGFCTTVNALNLKLFADADHAGYHINYGFTRGIGSVAYVLVSILLGYLTERITHRMLPLLGLVLCAVQFFAFFLFSRFVTEGQKADPFGEQNVTLSAFLKNNQRYCVFLTGVALLFFGHSTACNFLINLTRNVGGDTSDMGFINAFKGIIEIPMMFLYAWIFKKGKHALALRISAIAFVLKTIAFILAGNIWHLGAAFLLQAPSYALYMTAAVPYVKETIDYQNSAKAQSLAFTTTSFGGMLASLISGHLYDHISVTATLWIALLAGIAGTIVLFIGTRTPRTEGQSSL